MVKQNVCQRVQTLMELIPGISHDQLLGLARRFVGPDEAEDVVQTAYLKAHRSEGSFREECRRATWMYRITQRCALDVLRRRKRRPETALPTEGLLYRQDPTALNDLTEEVTARLRLVPEADRRVLLAMVEHGSCADAASAIGITTQAFKSRLNRARTRLRGLGA